MFRIVHIYEFYSTKLFFLLMFTYRGHEVESRDWMSPRAGHTHTHVFLLTWTYFFINETSKIFWTNNEKSWQVVFYCRC